MIRGSKAETAVEYRSEADLCLAFGQDAMAAGWTVYPEQGGWDMLLVRRGIQVGIQAKLVASNHMLLQALPSVGYGYNGFNRGQPKTGPHYRAVLFNRTSGRTPSARSTNLDRYAHLAQHLRLFLLHPHGHPIEWLDPVRNRWGTLRTTRYVRRLDWRWYRWRPEKPVWLPPFVPSHAAGVPSPTTVAPWKIAGVRLELLCRERQRVCLDDVKEMLKQQGITYPAESVLSRWCQCTGEKASGRQKWWVMATGQYARPPSKEWPEVFEALEDGSENNP